MITFRFMVFVTGFGIRLCVPPAPATTTTERPERLGNFNEELKGIKVAMKTLAEHLGKWNYVYISQLEPRISSSAATLANIDSNIRNLQERAHVWDTFQLHVAAWNEQLSTSDRKLDIISKAQEEMLILEGKVNSFSSVEYKIDKMFKKLEELEESLSDLNKKVENTGQFRDSLFGEFATRGILSTLKIIERKLDGMQLATQKLNAKQSLVKKNSDETKGKLTIKCNTPPVVEELLHDVASKVDIIFDRVSAKDYNVEEIENDDYLEDQNYSNEEADDSEADTDAKLISRVWKRLNQPWKQANKILDRLAKNLQAVKNNTVIILQNEQIYFENYKSCWSVDFKPVISGLVQDTEKIRLQLNYTYEKQMGLLENLFNEQKTYFSQFLKTLMENANGKIDKTRNSCASGEETTLHVTSETYHTRSSNNLSCDDIKFGEISGVYRLANHTEVGDSEAVYYTRYCEIREDGSWTVIQNRDNYVDLQNFSLDWYSYKMGFGQLHADFWFGNDFIHKLSHEQDLVLRIDLEDFEGNTAWAEYGQFRVASEYENYKLTIGEYRGNASDSLSSHNNSLFSTFDVKNDDAPDCCPCAESYGGGWWFNSCFESNLNGVYHRDPHSNEYFRGIIWEHWLGNYSLKKTKMMVRKKKVNYGNKTETTTDFGFLEDP